MNDSSSLKRIARSATIIGGANVIRVALGLARNKTIALLLGPPGVAVFGLFSNLIAGAALIATIGIDVSSVRSIARSLADNHRVHVTVRTLRLLCLIFGLIGAGIFWLARNQIALRFGVGLGVSGAEIGWLSTAVFCSVASACYVALLAGLGRIRWLATVTTLSAFAWTAAAIIAVWRFGRAGIFLAAIAGPFATFVFSLYFVRHERPVGVSPTLIEYFRESSKLLKLGWIIALTGVAASVSQLVARLLVQTEIGQASAGYFQAAWAISVTFLGVASTALVTDFFPRISSAVSASRRNSVVLANQQLEVTLAVFVPAILALVALAPFVIQLTYSNEFAPAAVQLRWQLQGDLIRSLTWPLGLYLLALGANGTYLLLEICWHLLYIALLWLSLKPLGLAAVGISFAVSTGLYFIAELILLWVLVKFKLSRRSVVLLAMFFVFSGFSLYLAPWSLKLSTGVGLLGSVLLGAFSLLRLLPAVLSKGRT